MACEELRGVDERAVLAAEDEYVAAEVRRDEMALRRLIDEHFVFNHSDGTTTGREALIRSILGWRMIGQTVRERTVRVVNDIALGIAKISPSSTVKDTSSTTARPS